MAYNCPTKSGHNMFEMASLLQKAIRRGEVERACYAAEEMYGAYGTVLWNRIMCISCEDCWGVVSKEIVALRYMDELRNKGKKKYEKDPQYVSKAVNLLCRAKKSRDACYFSCNFILTEDGPVEPPETYYVLETASDIEMVPDDAFSIKRISNRRGNSAAFSVSQTTLTGVESTYASVEVAAALRKAIRTLDMENAGRALDWLRKNDRQMIWKLLYCMAQLETKGEMLHEIVGIKLEDDYVNNTKPLEKKDEIYPSKAVMLMMYWMSGKHPDLKACDNVKLDSLIDWEMVDYLPIREGFLENGVVPEYVYDVHTLKGKMAGKTDWEMNLVEYAGLKPLQVGFFDDGDWSLRYEWKHKHGKCTLGEYKAMIEYKVGRCANPVSKIHDPFLN